MWSVKQNDEQYANDSLLRDQTRGILIIGKNGVQIHFCIEMYMKSCLHEQQKTVLDVCVCV